MLLCGYAGSETGDGGVEAMVGERSKRTLFAVRGVFGALGERGRVREEWRCGGCPGRGDDEAEEGLWPGGWGRTLLPEEGTLVVGEELAVILMFGGIEGGGRSVRTEDSCAVKLLPWSGPLRSWPPSERRNSASSCAAPLKLGLGLGEGVMAASLASNLEHGR